MRRHSGRSKAFAVALTAVVSLAACGPVGSEHAQVGLPAPEYAALSLEGDSVRLGDLVGKVVLLNVWATWCTPCREEIPELQALFEQHRSEGFEIVGVSVDSGDATDAIRQFAADYGITYQLWHDRDDMISTRYRLIGVPSSFLIDRQGIIRWSYRGPIGMDHESLNEALDSALEAT